jgi:hypothetical protein
MGELPDAAPSCVHNEGSVRLVFSGLNHTAFDLAVYASQDGSPHHHARLASRLLVRFYRTGLVTRRVPIKGLTSEMILLFRVAWRKDAIPNYRRVSAGAVGLGEERSMLDRINRSYPASPLRSSP